MVNTPTKRESLDNEILPRFTPTDCPLSAIVREGMRHRVEHHHTSQRAGRSRRTPKATVPSGTGADNVFFPCRPRHLSSNWEEERRGPDLLVRTSQFPSPGTSRPREPIEEGSEGASAVPVLFGTDTADAPTESPSHELQLHEQAQEVLAEIGAVLDNSPSIALDMEAPFGGEGKGSGVPLALSSEVGTQGRSRVHARLFAKSPLQSGLKRQKGEG
eukprot:2338134-Pleurochrysis_carterae.AAC.1